jgi:hypothetical protein
MSLSDLASLGTFVSAIAVLASLIFLYFQLRQIAEQVKQAERNQRGVLNQGYVDRTIEHLHWLAEPLQAELFKRVIEGEMKFNSEEVWRLGLAFRAGILNTQDAYLQHRAGLLDAATLEAALLSITRTYLRQPYFRALWTGSHRELFASEFAAEVDAIIARTEPLKPTNIALRAHGYVSSSESQHE